MAKVIVVVSSTHVQEDEAIISYSVSVIKTGSVAWSYSSDYQVNTALTLNNNLLTWRNKIMAQIAERGVTVIGSDFIIFGGPI